jgi:succinate dehydrogenase / fumarate reductase cytochrome b subunit
MAVNKNVWLRGLTYRGGGPMIAWIFHRLGGLAMILFIGMHIYADFLMQQFGSNIGTAINTVYESPYFQVFLYFFVIFHSVNGLRIIITDIWPRLLEYQRELIWLEWLIIIPIYGLSVFIMIQSALSGG